MDNKHKAQQRADRVEGFHRELDLLQREGILRLEESQCSAVEHYHGQLLEGLRQTYDIDTGTRQKQLSAGMMIASFIGALALAASVFFLFYQFWGYFTTPVQVAVLVTAPLLTLAATVAAARRETTAYFAKLLSMVSFACFVLNLVMLGQIFNILPSENALVVWAIYAGLLAYAFDVRLLLAAGILAFAGFIAARTATWSGFYWLSMGERPETFFLPALITFTLPLWLSPQRYSGFEPIYRVFGCLLLLVPLLVLSNWGGGSYLPLDTAIIEGLYQLLGFLASAGLIALGIRRQWPDTANTGNLFFVLFLYTKFFDWWWEIMPKYLFFLVIALASLLLLLIYKRLRQHSQTMGVSYE